MAMGPRNLIETKRAELVILILCVFIGIVLRFYTFDQKSFWLDEIHTFNDSRYGLNAQIEFYKNNPTYLHPPLFFVITHVFYPFSKPERDLRIIPLIFGIISIPMIYFLSKTFTPRTALACTIFFSFMTYHISLSQEGRSYSMLLFLGIMGLYFFMKHLETFKKQYLFLVASFFSVMFYTSYSSIPFILFTQLLWFYQKEGRDKKHLLSFFLYLNSIMFLLCLPWILFILLNYKGQPFVSESLRTIELISLGNTLYGILNDWVPLAPLAGLSGFLLISLPVFSENKRNAIILLLITFLPVVGLYFYCTFNKITHFITSRYFIAFLPVFLISLYSSIDIIEDKFKILKKFFRLKLLFTILLVISNLIILPVYYRSEKQDFRGLVAYLKSYIRDGDKIIVGSKGYIPGLLHYFGVTPQGRHYLLSTRKVSNEEVEYKNSLIIQNKKFTISYSNTYWIQYALEGSRLWIIVDKKTALKIQNLPFCDLKGNFDGSFLNYDRFPTDATMYLFLMDILPTKNQRNDVPIK